MFFIDHTAKATSFIDPRLPNDLPLLQNEAAGVNHLTIPSLLPPLPPRHHGASLTPPPSARAPSPASPGSPMSPNLLAPPSDGVNRRRSRSVGDEELNSCLTQQNSNMITYSGSASPTLAYNDRVVAFLRQPNIFHILKEKNDASISNYKNLKEKVVAIRQEGTAALNRLSHDVELTLILRYVNHLNLLKSLRVNFF